MDDAVVVVVEANNGPEDRGSDREVDRLSERSGGSVSRLENYSLASGLPKIELKSPARVMQEEEEAVGGAERAGGPRAASRAEPDKTKATSKQVRIWLICSQGVWIRIRSDWESFCLIWIGIPGPADPDPGSETGSVLFDINR
jgi:hypothetical protein